MLKLKDIAKDILKESCKRRGFEDVNIDELYELNREYIVRKQDLDKLYAEKKQFSHLDEKAKNLKQNTKELEVEVDRLEKKLKSLLEIIPNILHESVPEGTEGKIIKQWKDIVFTRHHYEMGIIHPCTPSGARFVFLEKEIATLERALGQFMMDSLINNYGFTEYSMPYIIKSEFLYKTCHLPKEAQNMFHDEDYYLIPTSEVILMANEHNKKFSKGPLKMTSLTDCFRKEAGAAGRDTKGLIRLHQFKKCEMVVLIEASKSYEMLEEMLNISESLLKELEIPYVVKALGAKDIGFCSAKTYDIEIPIGGQWREVASISNFETFQTLGLNIKYEDGKLLHSLNGSALAVGRTLASLLEVHYDNGVITIPACLHKYTGFNHIKL